MEDRGFVEVSEMLHSGVYALCWNDQVMYIGQSQLLVQRLYSYIQTRKKYRWVKFGSKKIRGLVFNKVWVRTCPVEDLDDLEKAMIRFYNPKYNEKLKQPIALPDLLTSLMVIPPPKMVDPTFRRRV